MSLVGQYTARKNKGVRGLKVTVEGREDSSRIGRSKGVWTKKKEEQKRMAQPERR